MSKFNITDICKKIGAKNGAENVVVAVAIFKGIFRPIFTMSDKKQDPKSKKYAAIREGATELIAIPSYLCMAKLAEHFAPKFSPKGKEIGQVLSNTKTTLGFFGVCVAALIVIPGLCNLAMPSILKLFKVNKPAEPKKVDTTKPEINPVASAVPKTFQTINTSPNVYKPTVQSAGGLKV